MADEGMSLRDFLRVPFRQRAIMNTSIITVLLIVSFYIAFKTPVYESKVKILVSSEKNIQSPYQKQLYEERTAHPGLTQSEIVKSAPVLERAVKALHLDTRPLDYEKEFASPLKSMLIEFIATSKNNKLNELSPKEQKTRLFQSAVNNLRNRVEVEPVKSTDVFLIKVRDFDPLMAAATANAISRSYLIMDLEQQLADLMNKYGNKNPAVKQFKDDIDYMAQTLNGKRLPDIEAIGPASVKIIEQADIPINHVGPRISIVVALGVFLSAALGLTLVFVFESLDPTFKSGQEIEEYLKIQLLGSVPKSGYIERDYLKTGYKKTENFRLKKIREGQLYIADSTKGKENTAKHELEPASEVVEFTQAKEAVPEAVAKPDSEVKFDPKLEGIYIRSLQNLSDQVFILAKESNIKTIMVTTATAQEEIYSTVGNLGAELADKNKVLLIDANFHNVFTDKLRKKPKPLGFLDILSEKTGLHESIQHIGSKLYLLSSGSWEPNPVFLLNGPKMAELMQEVKNAFDFVLIACPDLTGYKDAQVISRYTDSAIVVVQENLTRRKVLEQALKPLIKQKTNIIGAILNNHAFPIPKFFYERL